MAKLCRRSRRPRSSGLPTPADASKRVWVVGASGMRASGICTRAALRRNKWSALERLTNHPPPDIHPRPASDATTGLQWAAGVREGNRDLSEGVPERWSADVRRPSSACGPARATGIRNAEHKRHANSASISWVRNSGWAGRSPQSFALGTRITARAILAKRQGHRYRHAEQPNGTIEDYRTRIAWRAAISTTCAWNRKDGMPARSSPFS